MKKLAVLGLIGWGVCMTIGTFYSACSFVGLGFLNYEKENIPEEKRSKWISDYAKLACYTGWYGYKKYCGLVTG